jgi:hypothetical protein
MAGHTVRAELLGVDERDDAYEDLHAAMAKRDSWRTIKWGSGKTYGLRQNRTAQPG